MADESQQNQHDTSKRHHKILVHLPIIIKVLEVVVAIFAVGLAVDPLNSFQHITHRRQFKLDDAATIYVTLAGYILINALFILGHILGDRVPKRTLMLFAAVGALLHVVAGSLIVHIWRKNSAPSHYLYNNEIYGSKQYMDMLVSAAVFTFVNVAVFVAEIVATIRYS